MSKEVYYALDLGTTKFCLAKYDLAASNENPFNAVTVPADGMRRGMLADMYLAEIRLKELLERAEKEFGADITSAVVGVAGSHLRGTIIRNSNDIGLQTVTADHLHSLALLEKNQLPDNEGILHRVPLSYRVDKREWVRNPVGFSGTTLESESFLIQGQNSYMKDIVTLCNNSGLHVDRLYAEPYASAMVTVSREAMQEGVIIADIGGGTTDGIIFRAGLPIGLFSINIGGKLITSDLSIGLGISENSAESLKVNYGLAIEDSSATNENLQTRREVSMQHEAYKIMQARVQELCKNIHKKTYRYNKFIGYGIILTGGSCQLRGIRSEFSKEFLHHIECTHPAIPNIHNDALEVDPNADINPIAYRYATAVGLIYLSLTDSKSRQSNSSSRIASKYLKGIWKWVKELA